MFKYLRTYSLICFLALASNLVGNLVWTYVWQKDSVELASEEEDSDSDSDSDSGSNSNKSTKTGVNLLEEELHLTQLWETTNVYFSFILLRTNGFHSEIEKPVGQDRIPLDNPPEMTNVLS